MYLCTNRDKDESPTVRRGGLEAVLGGLIRETLFCGMVLGSRKVQEPTQNCPVEEGCEKKGFVRRDDTVSPVMPSESDTLNGDSVFTGARKERGFEQLLESLFLFV